MEASQDFRSSSQILLVIPVICLLVADSGSRVLTLVQAVPAEHLDSAAATSTEQELADVVTLQRRRQARLSADDEQSFFVDTLSEYQWARDAAGLAPSTLSNLVKPVIEVCDHYGTVPWRLTQREVDRYFSGPGKRARSTQRAKAGQIDAFYAFLEQRYAGEIMRRFGAVVESPIDSFNRPQHRAVCVVAQSAGGGPTKPFTSASRSWASTAPIRWNISSACRSRTSACGA